MESKIFKQHTRTIFRGLFFFLSIKTCHYLYTVTSCARAEKNGLKILGVIFVNAEINDMFLQLYILLTTIAVTDF